MNFYIMSGRNVCIFAIISSVCYIEVSSFSLCPSNPNKIPPYSTRAPINIDTKKTIPIKASSPLVIKKGSSGKLRVMNTGTDFEADTLPVSSKTYGISGGILCDRFYRLYKIRFYQNPNLEGSSVHLINGKGTPLSASLITFNSKYESIDVAQKYTDGIAVVNFQFIFSDSSNQGFKKQRAPIIRQIRKPGTSVDVPAAEFTDASYTFPPLHTYYAYNGSFTARKSGELRHATIIVLSYKFPIISVAQYKNTFLKLMNENGTVLQSMETIDPTGKRPVYKVQGDIELEFLPI